jgi:hypothetical protein
VRTRSRWLVLCAALGVLVAGCGKFRRGVGEPPATLIFRNDSFDQATVYVVRDGSDSHRLGVVPGGRTDTLVVSSDLIRGAVNIVARLLARSNYPQTGQVTINPGEWYELTLTSDSRLISFLPARQ